MRGGNEKEKRENRKGKSSERGRVASKNLRGFQVDTIARSVISQITQNHGWNNRNFLFSEHPNPIAGFRCIRDRGAHTIVAVIKNKSLKLPKKKKEKGKKKRERKRAPISIANLVEVN